MATAMQLGRDINGYVTYRIYFSDTNYSTNLAANTNQTLTVPTNVTDAIFSYNPGGNVWVAVGASDAEVPGGSFAATNSVLNPVARRVYPGQTLNFITADTNAYVSVAFYNSGQ